MTEQTEQYFINEQSDFFSYMVDNALFKTPKTYHDYVSRLRYISKFYRLDNTLTLEGVTDIINGLRQSMDDRDRYNTDKGINDLKSGLKRFLEYVQSDYRKRLADTVLHEELMIKNDNNISITEREAIVKSRVGQGLFRDELISYWHGCSVTECKTIPLLMASHIRPWRKSDNQQRLDVFNGLLLTPNLDKLFDRGYISFDKRGKIICSDALPKADLKSLAISPSMGLIKIEDQHNQYLQYHREYCLLWVASHNFLGILYSF